MNGLGITKGEADDAFDEAIERYIEDIVLPEIPEPYQFYFDRKQFREAAQNEGRGAYIAGYDGKENEETIDGTAYYIYRMG